MSKRKRKFRERQVLSPKTLVDIIIPVFNNFELLRQCLDAIPAAAKDIPYQIVIFDNASTEENGFYGTLSRDIKVIKNHTNLGFVKACNISVARSNSPLIFLLNSDVILEPNSIDFLVKEMDNPNTGVAGMRLVFPEYADGLNQEIRPAGKLQHIGLTTNIRGEWTHAFIGWNADHPRVMAQREVYAVTGAAFITRRNLWVKIGGFFEGYGMGTFEDVDYCMSTREAGLKVVVVPEALGTHYTSATAEKYKLGYNLYGNHMTFMQRWQNKLQWQEYTQV